MKTADVSEENKNKPHRTQHNTTQLNARCMPLPVLFIVVSELPSHVTYPTGQLPTQTPNYTIPHTALTTPMYNCNSFSSAKIPSMQKWWYIGVNQAEILI